MRELNISEIEEVSGGMGFAPQTFRSENPEDDSPSTIGAPPLTDDLGDLPVNFCGSRCEIGSSV